VNALLDLIKRNPQRLMLVVRSGLAMAMGFGLGLSGEQVALVVVFIEAVLLLPAEGGTTAMANPNLPVGTPVNNGAAVVASVTPPPEPTASVEGITASDVTAAIDAHRPADGGI